MENWLSNQISLITDNWSKSISQFYPWRYRLWTNPEEYLKTIKCECNVFDAVKYLNWEEYLKCPGMRILDLGCGVGWVSAFLSTFPNVKQIEALDSDRNNLEIMLPEIVTRMGGIQSKITPIRGLFSPIFRENGYYDLIVAVSAMHHAQNMFSLLRELRRVLRPGGNLIILNEIPYVHINYLRLLSRAIISIMLKALRKKTTEFEQGVSPSGILIDPYLEDYVHAFYQWEYAIRQCGFNYKVILTPYFYYKNVKGQKGKLVHFVCS